MEFENDQKPMASFGELLDFFRPLQGEIVRLCLDKAKNEAYVEKAYRGGVKKFFRVESALAKEMAACGFLFRLFGDWWFLGRRAREWGDIISAGGK